MFIFCKLVDNLWFKRNVIGSKYYYMILPKEEFKKRAMLVGSKNYSRFFPWFVKILKKSRFPYLKHNGFWMGAMQMNMLKTLFRLQNEMRQVKTGIAQAKTKKERKRKQKKLLIYKEWIRVLQTIADGIAWRNLRFNRPIIRLFSENNPPGHLNQINQNYINVLNSYLGKMPNLVLVNDLTRCLRIADLTRIFSDNKIILYELKKGGKKAKDMNTIFNEMRRHKRFFSKQELKQWVVQSAIINKKILVPILINGKTHDKLKAEIVDLDFPIQTHFSEIKRLIKKADNNGYCYAQAELEQGYFIEISAYDEAVKRNNSDKILRYRKAQYENNTPGWVKNRKKIITISNYESFLQERGQYTRNILPYSILPFSAKNCVRLMMGYLHVKIYYNLNTLEEKIKKMGWVIKKKEKSLSYLKKQNQMAKMEYEESGNFYKYNLDEVLYYLSKKDESGTYNTAILTTQVLIMISSMYKTKFLIDEIDLLYSKAKKRRRGMGTITINYLGEQKVLV